MDKCSEIMVWLTMERVNDPVCCVRAVKILTQMERMMWLSDLSSVITHEIRTMRLCTRTNA